MSEVLGDNLRQRATSGVKWNGGAAGTQALLQFVTIALLARLLEPEAFGLMSMAVVVTGFASLFEDAGISNAIIYHQDATDDELSTLYWFNALAGLILFLVVYLLTPFAVLYFREPEVEPVLRWAAASFLITPWGQQFAVLLQKDLEFRTLSLQRIIEQLVYTASVITFALLGLGVMSLVFGHLIRAGTRTLLLVGAAIRRHLLPRLRFAIRDLDRFSSFGLYQLGERSLNYAANNVDYLIVGRLLGADALGFYTLAYNLVRSPSVLLNPVVTSVAFPAFARVQHDDMRLRRGYRQIIRYISSVTFPMMAGLLVVAPLFVPIVYGPSWAPAVTVVQIFCLLGALKSLGNPTGSLLLAKGRADWGFYLNLLSVVALTAFNLVGSRWGLEGVAASSVLFLVLMFPIGVYLRRVLIGLTLGEYVRSFAPALGASLGLGLATVLLGAAIPGSIAPWNRLLILIGIGVVSYAVALASLDRDFFHDLRLRLGSTPDPAAPSRSGSDARPPPDTST